MNDEVVLNLQNISKQFFGVKALNGVSFELKKGEIHALCGENGAGKSTLLKILNGTYSTYEGNIVLHGNPVKFKNTKNAANLGISVIPQEIQMALDLTVAENIYMGKYPKTKVGFVDWDKMEQETKGLLTKLGKNVEGLDPKTKVKDLSMGYRQVIEILKALSSDVDILALDEPTSSLSEEETKQLFILLKDLSSKGVSIIYVSHKLKEIFEICDRITVIKDGSYVGTKEISGVDMNEVVRMMVGRDFSLFKEKNNNILSSEIYLDVKGLTRKGIFNNISFNIAKGEILGFFGIVGSGRSEVARAIFGVDRFDEGEIYVKGKKVTINKPSEAVKLGMGFVTEDRHGCGLNLDFTIRKNITLPSLEKILKYGLISSVKEREMSGRYIEKLKIKTPSDEFVTKNLSGGNQQKVVVAKWLAREIDILIIDEPTRGIDIGTKSEMYALIRSLANEGVAVMLISSEMPEILGLCDRVIVFRGGSAVAEFVNNEDLTDVDILKKAIIH